MDGSGTRIDLFAPDGRFLGRTRVRVPGCPLGLSGGLVPWRDGFVTHGLCGGPGGARWAVAATGLDGRARVVASVPLGSDGRVGSLLGRGVLSWQDRIWIGSPDGCFSAVLPEAGERACMPADDLPALPDSIRRALAPRGRVGGYEVALPERWPAFVGTEWSPRGPLLVLPPDATSPDGALAVLEPDGSLTVVRSPERAWPGPVALLLARTRLDGTAFRVEGWR